MSKKRANNEGTIRQHASGLWEARFTAGYDAAGKQIRKSLYANTKEEVGKRLREALRALERVEFVEPADMTVAEWLDTWFKVYGRPRWRDSTAAEHYRNIQQNLKPKLGRHKLQRLRHEHIQDYVNQQASKGRASTSIKKQLEPLRASLKQAVINNLIIKDPSLHLALPSTPAREIQFLTIDEQRKLIGVLPDTTSGRALHFVLGTGVRASELCGLRWMDIEGDRFTIRNAVQRVVNLDRQAGEPKYKTSSAPPKTKAGLRTIPLTDSMMDLLQKQQEAQRLERIKAGSAWTGDQPAKGGTFVFANELGGAIDRANLGRVLRICLDKAGVKRVGIHALRHTFATNCVRAGVDVRTLSEMIGHTKIAFTLQQYVHTNLNTMREALQAVDGLRGF
jgi:site-specific recombinase XerD